MSRVQRWNHGIPFCHFSGQCHCPGGQCRLLNLDLATCDLVLQWHPSEVFATRAEKYKEQCLCFLSASLALSKSYPIEVVPKVWEIISFLEAAAVMRVCLWTNLSWREEIGKLGYVPLLCKSSPNKFSSVRPTSFWFLVKIYIPVTKQIVTSGIFFLTASGYLGSCRLCFAESEGRVTSL